MATAVRSFVIFVLLARSVVGLLFVAILMVGLVGLGGIANPSASHENRLLLGLCFEAIACIAGVPLVLYIQGRPTNNPSLNALVLMALGPSLIPFWSSWPFVKANEVIGWGVVIGLFACGVFAMMWPREAPARTPTSVRGYRERSETPVNPNQTN